MRHDVRRIHSTAPGADPAHRANRLTPSVIAEWKSGLGVDPSRIVDPMPSANTFARVGFTSSRDEPLRTVRYGHMLSQSFVYSSLQSPVRIECTAETIKADPREVLIASVSPIRGESTVWQRGQVHKYAPRDLILVPTLYPFLRVTTSIHESSGLFIRLSSLGGYRYLVERPRRPSGPDTPLARAAATFMRHFAIEAAMTGASVPVDTELAALDLVTAALAELALDGRYSLQDDKLFMRQSAVDLIARRYRDPALTPDVVADELHVSRRHLYRLFEGERKSPAMLITDARVEAARKMLDADHRVQVGDVAAASGFGSLATFRNQFKARHGVGPSEYRERRRE